MRQQPDLYYQPQIFFRVLVEQVCTSYSSYTLMYGTVYTYICERSPYADCILHRVLTQKPFFGPCYQRSPNSSSTHFSHLPPACNDRLFCRLNKLPSTNYGYCLCFLIQPHIHFLNQDFSQLNQSELFPTVYSCCFLGDITFWMEGICCDKR